MAYVYQPYPKAVYHRSFRETGRGVVVNDPVEHDALTPAEDWAESPAAFDAPEVVPEPEKPKRGRPRKVE